MKRNDGRSEIDGVRKIEDSLRPHGGTFRTGEVI